MCFKKITTICVLFFVVSTQAKIKVLIVDGQNNHDVWPKSTIMMKQYLEETGLFTVAIARTHFIWKAEKQRDYLPIAALGEKEMVDKPKIDSLFSPNFNKYDVVVSNFGWQAADWPKETQIAFEKFIKKGGGFVVVHAADNCFPTWDAYNKIIGLGGWGDRDGKSGPYVYYSNEGQVVRDSSEGKAGAHGSQHNIPITVREPNHPITQGMPEVWLSGKDECYSKLRGPAENMIILATGKDASGKAPTDRYEPILMVLTYCKGRIFHTTLGHDDYSLENVGFIVSFTRGVEWAATGKVTQPIPMDFPTNTNSIGRKFTLK